MSTDEEYIRILDAGDSCPTMPILEDGAGVARAVVWPGVGAESRSFHRIDLNGDGATKPFAHPSEAVYYVVRGNAEVVDLDVGERQSLGAGSMIHVDPGTSYRFVAAPGGAEILGGPCPPDPAMYRGMSTA